MDYACLIILEAFGRCSDLLVSTLHSDQVATGGVLNDCIVGTLSELIVKSNKDLSGFILMLSTRKDPSDLRIQTCLLKVCEFYS